MHHRHELSEVNLSYGRLYQRERPLPKREGDCEATETKNLLCFTMDLHQTCL